MEAPEAFGAEAKYIDHFPRTIAAHTTFCAYIVVILSPTRKEGFCDHWRLTGFTMSLISPMTVCLEDKASRRGTAITIVPPTQVVEALSLISV